MADHVPSQGNFIGWLALCLMVLAVLAAIFVLVSGLSQPAAMI